MMECSVAPTPREYMHTIFPHGHTRRVPVEAECRVNEIAKCVFCPCQAACCQCDSEIEAHAPVESSGSTVRIKHMEDEAKYAHDSDIFLDKKNNLTSHSAEILAVDESPIQDEQELLVQESPVQESEGNALNIPVLFFSPPDQRSRESSKSESPEQLPDVPTVTNAAPLEDGAQQSLSWLNCWNQDCCGSSLQPEPEGPPPPFPEQAVPVPLQESTESVNQIDDVGGWSANCCKNLVQPESESIPSHTDNDGPPSATAAMKTETPQKEDEVVIPQKVPRSPVIEKKEKREGIQVVYIDHCPESFVKSYFGDDGSVEIPNDYRDLRFNTAAEIIFAAGSAVGVVVTGGAVLIGAAALTAGLTVGIAAKEIYKRLQNNYDI